MKGIDYSKWDKLDVSDEESCGTDTEDNACGGVRRGQPSVTRLSYPSQVTIGPNGVHMTSKPSPAAGSPFQDLPHKYRVDTNSNSDEDRIRSTMSAGKPCERSAMTSSNGAAQSRRGDDAVATLAYCPHKVDHTGETECEDELMYSGLTRDGGREGDSHLWSQTRDTVTVSFIVPYATKGKDVSSFRVYEADGDTWDDDDRTGISRSLNNKMGATITFTLSAVTKSDSDTKSTILDSQDERDRTSTGGANMARETVLVDRRQSTAVTTTWTKQFRYPVELSEDLLTGCWQLHTLKSMGLRLMVVQLTKESVAPGLTLWWDRCFATDTQSIIDTRTISARTAAQGSCVQHTGTDVAQSRAELADTWAKAHEIFYQRMKERKPCAIKDEDEKD